MGRVQGKVAFITGAGRGQGRSHALRLAEEGADIIAVDICEDIPTIGYPMATSEDLDETAKLVEKTGRGIVAVKADVREAAQLKAALDAGLAEFGKLDIVVAQAGVAAMIAYDKATIGGVIDRLVAKGLVARSVSERDRRAREVRLTDAGQACFDALLPIVRTLQDDILAPLAPEERRRFLNLARKLIDGATAS